MRYAVIPNHYMLGRTPKISWQVADVDAGCTPRFFPKRIVASCTEEGTASQIAAHFNGTNPHAEHWKASYQSLFDSQAKVEERWQRCLDTANANTAEARKEVENERASFISAMDRNGALMREVERLQGQLFEAREQRDEARAEAEEYAADTLRGPFAAGGTWCFNEDLQPELVSDMLKRVQKIKAELVTCERLNRAQNEAIGNLRFERDKALDSRKHPNCRCTLPETDDHLRKRLLSLHGLLFSVDYVTALTVAGTELDMLAARYNLVRGPAV